MGDCKEVLFISDDSGVLQCVDPRIGTTIVTYRGISSVKKNSVTILGNDFLIAAENNKPLLTAWALNSQEPIPGPKLVLAGQATALASSPDGVHSAVAIDAKLYIYQNNSGALLGVFSKHYRGINKILFMDDSVHLVTCGENGTVMVWNLASALSSYNSPNPSAAGSEPLYTFSHHSLPVTDAYVGPAAVKGRLYTASLDQTVKMYGLQDGSLLLSVAFEDSITALRPNSVDTVLYLGTPEGKIFEYTLDPLPRSLEHQVEESEMQKPLVGHKKAVTCLSISIDGHMMVSGSDDCSVIVWDLPSRQLLRIFNLKGPVSAIILTLGVENIFTDNFQPNVAFQNFQRVSSDDRSLKISVLIKENLQPIEYSNLVKSEDVIQNDTGSENVDELKLQLAKAIQRNKELYQFAMDKVLSNAFSFEGGAEEKKKLKKNGPL